MNKINWGCIFFWLGSLAFAATFWSIAAYYIYIVIRAIVVQFGLTEAAYSLFHTLVGLIAIFVGFLALRRRK